MRASQTGEHTQTGGGAAKLHLARLLQGPWGCQWQPWTAGRGDTRCGWHEAAARGPKDTLSVDRLPDGRYASIYGQPRGAGRPFRQAHWHCHKGWIGQAGQHLWRCALASFAILHDCLWNAKGRRGQARYLPGPGQRKRQVVRCYKTNIVPSNSQFGAAGCKEPPLFFFSPISPKYRILFRVLHHTPSCTKRQAASLCLLLLLAK